MLGPDKAGKPPGHLRSDSTVAVRNSSVDTLFGEQTPLAWTLVQNIFCKMRRKQQTVQHWLVCICVVNWPVKHSCYCFFCIAILSVNFNVGFAKAASSSNDVCPS